MIDFLTFMHIVGVTLLLFAVGALNFSSVMIRRTTDVNEFRIYLSLSKTAGMMTPIAVVILSVFGVWAASEIGFSMTAGWLIAAYITVVVALVVPFATLKRWGEQAGKLMPEAMAEGRILESQKELVASNRSMAVDLFMNGLLIFILFDMVYKPF